MYYKKLFLVLPLAVISSASFADFEKWTRISEDKNLTVYADASTLERYGNLAKIWALFDLRSPIVDGNVQTQSVRFFRTYDCSGKRYFRSAEWAYSGHMGQGTVDQDNRTLDWRSVAPGTIDESMWKFACGNQPR